MGGTDRRFKKVVGAECSVCRMTGIPGVLSRSPVLISLGPNQAWYNLPSLLLTLKTRLVFLVSSGIITGGVC